MRDPAMGTEMTKLVRIVMLGIGLTVAIPQVSVAQGLVVPAYAPLIGRELAFRVQLETTIDMRGAEPLGPGTARGDFINRLTVLGRTPNGFRMLWQFDAALSPGAPGSESDYPLNQTFRDAIGFYAVDGLDVDSDAAGKPVAVFGIDLIIKNIQKKVDASLGPGNAPQKGSILERMQRELAANPVFPVDALVPAARLLASAQRDRARSDLSVGATETDDQILQYGGVDTRATVSRTLQSVDPSARSATFVWTLDVDQAAYTRGMRDMIDREFDALRRKLGEIPSERMAELTSAEIHYSGESRVSLDDGAAIFVEETIVSRIGPIYTKVVSRVTRQ